MGRGQLRHIAPRKAGEHQHPGPAGQRRQLGQHLQSIHTGKHEIHHHDVRGELLCQAASSRPDSSSSAPVKTRRNSSLASATKILFLVSNIDTLSSRFPCPMFAAWPRLFTGCL